MAARLHQNGVLSFRAAKADSPLNAQELTHLEGK
jgi:hypothetical protein